MSEVFYTCCMTVPAVTLSKPFKLDGQDEGDEWRVTVSTDDGGDFGYNLHFADKEDALMFLVHARFMNGLVDALNERHTNVFDLGECMFQLYVNSSWYKLHSSRKEQP